MELACVAAVSFSFRGGDRTSDRKSGGAKKHAWGVQKIREKWGGGGARRGRVWREKESRFLCSLHPLPLLLIFCTPLRFSSLCVSFWKRLLNLVPRVWTHQL